MNRTCAIGSGRNRFGPTSLSARKSSKTFSDVMRIRNYWNVDRKATPQNPISTAMKVMAPEYRALDWMAEVFKLVAIVFYILAVVCLVGVALRLLGGGLASFYLTAALLSAAVSAALTGLLYHGISVFFKAFLVMAHP